MATTIAAAISSGAARLSAAGFDTPRLDIEILVRHLLGIDRTALFVRPHEPLSDQKLADLGALVDRRLAGQPIAYLTGEREFMGMPFRVGPGVLVPRPETELLVEDALAWLKNRDEQAVLDVGTGSGAIAISIAKLSPNSKVIASDASMDALRWAALNRDELHAPVELVLGDLTEPFSGPIDFLLANLPYLRPEQLAGNRDIQAEPEMALVSGIDGLDLIRRLLAAAPRVMSSRGAIGLEIDPDQTRAVESLARDRFPNAIITTRVDLAGFPRHVWVDLSSGGTE